MYAPIFHRWFCKERHLLLQMDLSLDCPLHCIHCYRYSHPPRLSSISARGVDVLEKEVFPFFRTVNLSTVGEPLMSPVLSRVISAAKRSGVRKVGMTTNGTLLTEEASRDLLERGLDWLAISVDASTPETYESIRQGGDWELLMENLASLKRVRAQFSGCMNVALNFTIMDQNAHEAILFPSLAHDLGVDSISFLPLTIERWEMRSWSLFYSPNRWNCLMQGLRQAVEQACIPARIPDDLPDDDSPKTGSVPPTDGAWCPAVEESWIFMTPDGNCYLCPNVVSEGPFGNVFETPFREIWASRANQEIRKNAMELGKVPGCDHCKFFALHRTPVDEAAYLSKHLKAEWREEDHVGMFV